MLLKMLLKKILLIFFGLILSLLLLEVFLQSASFTIKHIKDYKTYHKHKKIKTKDTITILCIGESTTRGHYPIQLQKILDNLSPGRFSVIDCGIPGTTLDIILEVFDENVKKHNPDIVVFMMGINNGFYSSLKDTPTYEETANKTKIKTYKLFLLLKIHILSVINQTHIIENTNSEQKKPDPNLKEETAYLKLANLYYNSTDNKHKGYEMAVSGIKLNFIKDKKTLYAMILDYNIRHGNRKELKLYADLAINESIDLFRNYYAYFIYGFIQDIISDEQRNKILSVLTKKDQSYGLLAIDNLKYANYSKAEEYFKKSEELRLNFPNKVTNQLYKSIIKKSVNANLKIICMQYPVRNIEPLKNILENEDYYNKIIFVSNENIFKQMLKKHPYKYLFTDQFAGDFGHCTPLGNKLIAENVAKTIIDLTK